MRIFMSFSGQLSLAVAERFRAWLPGALQASPEFSFSPDLPKGDIWDARLDAELDGCEQAIAFVTEINSVSPWLNYEVGALSRGGRGVFVVVCDDVKSEALPLTLSRFQLTRLEEKDVFRLLRDLSTNMGRETDASLEASFRMTWPHLEGALKETLAHDYEDQGVVTEERSSHLIAPVYRSHRFADVPDRMAQAKRQIDIIQTYIPDYRTIVDCLEEAVQKGCDVRLLLLHPRSRYLEERLRRMKRPLTEPENSLIALQQLSERTRDAKGSIHIRTYESIPHFPYYRIDGEAFVGFFLPEGSFVQPQILFTRKSFPRLFDYFEESWTRADEHDRVVALLEDLRAERLQADIVGWTKKHVARDASLYQGRPIAYTKLSADDAPHQTAQVARRLIQLARKHGISLTVTGSRTSVAGQATNRGGLIVDMTARTRSEPRPQAAKPYVRVDPGVVLDDLNEQANEGFVPILFEHTLDLSSSHMATIGGALMNNGGGILSHKYGSADQIVKDLEVVIPGFQDRYLWTSTVPRDHRDIYEAVENILRTTGIDAIRAAYEKLPRKNATGYNIKPLADALHRGDQMDMTQLFIGSEGTLCVLVRADVWVHEYRPTQESVILFFASPEHMAHVVRRLMSRESRETWPSAAEVISGSILSLIEELGSLGELGAIPKECRPPAELSSAMLIVEFDAPRDLANKLCDELVAEHQAFTTAQGVSDKAWYRCTDDGERERLWFLRKNIVRILNIYADRHHLVAPPVIEDIAVPIEQLGNLIQYLETIFREHHLRAAIFGHAASGNLHVRPLFRRSREGMEQAKSIMNAVYDEVLNMNGTISGEHGDGLLRTPFLEKRYPPAVLEAFRQIKALMDPEGILNPGVKVRSEKFPDRIYEDWVIEGYLPMGGGRDHLGEETEHWRLGQFKP